MMKGAIPATFDPQKIRCSNSTVQFSEQCTVYNVLYNENTIPYRSTVRVQYFGSVFVLS